MNNIDSLSIATIRSLCIDMINKANSGHPGMAIGSAPILYTLFTKHLVANPKDPKWVNRDRFVLSAGHASSLLYSILHLCGYDISLEDLKSFRQLGSLTPGHPEFNFTPGIDATSGPLGQGIAQSVGLAIAEQSIQASYEHGKELMNHYTYVLCGDGCLEEGLSQEAISLAGLQKLNKLILFYDANQVTLDGPISLSFNESVKGRFTSSNWNVLEVNDGNDIDAIDSAILEAKKSEDKPTLIIVHTVIGQGSKNEGTSKVHGAPLGVEDGKYAKLSYGFDNPDFFIPNEVKEHFVQTFINRNLPIYESYQNALKQLELSNPKEIEAFKKSFSNDNINTSFDYEYDPKGVSTRVASGKFLNLLQDNNTCLIGGSADVAGSVMTKLTNGTHFEPSNRAGRNLNFGIREFAMASAQNGILLHGGLRSYVGSFFVFSDYMKSAIRMSALSKLPAIYLFSHDSVAVGEDGPTHQPIEHLAALRSMPNVTVIRPCDEKETVGAWKYAISNLKGPTCLILSRQGLPLLDNSCAEDVNKGAYVIRDCKNPKFILLATGSEVSLSNDVSNILESEGLSLKVVSMPSWEIFEKQSEKYKNSVLSLPREKIISVEMLSSFGWDKYAKYHLSIDTYGTSAHARDTIKHFGFDKDSVINFIKSIN